MTKTKGVNETFFIHNIFYSIYVSRNIFLYFLCRFSFNCTHYIYLYIL